MTSTFHGTRSSYKLPSGLHGKWIYSILIITVAASAIAIAIAIADSFRRRDYYFYIQDINHGPEKKKKKR